MACPAAAALRSQRPQRQKEEVGRRLYLHSIVGHGAANAKNGDDPCRVAGVCLLPAFADKYPDARVWLDGKAGKAGSAVCYRLVKQGPAGQEVLAMEEV
ncbi:hypothetical protein HYH03_007282 [Edaphochlamys debaryana]|uniref:Uncharacterized protein n=1 Tax=Edaphochlamys debaryana TaxID=47281 RepID=A0A836C0I7_9CHLO|nr:hypothetical protein HYH03_007282 [Edaphochlamys debaryana]|eukprot:KAG2494514.1 hypothetical protein HYH03_007282 [Edaphochlamys debaryana]